MTQHGSKRGLSQRKGQDNTRQASNDVPHDLLTWQDGELVDERQVAHDANSTHIFIQTHGGSGIHLIESGECGRVKFRTARGSGFLQASSGHVSKVSRGV